MRNTAKKNKKRVGIISLVMSSIIAFNAEGIDMSIIKWRPLFDLEESFDKSFREQGFDLAIDVYEEGNNVIAKMNVPGIDADNIDIHIDDQGNLHVSGERSEEKEQKDKDYYHKEIRKGSFHRAVSLPSQVDEENITATMKDGVLVITMPKLVEEEKQVKKIKVQRL